MKQKHTLLFSLLVLIFSISAINTVYAPEESLGSGYAVTSNRHGIDVPPGSNVIVTAMTTDAGVYQVTFLWKNPADHTVWTDVVVVYQNGSKYDSMPISYANSTHAPDEIGDWGVQALFQSPDGTTKQQIEEVIAIKATSFFAIPEIPIIGTAGATIAMLLGLGLFATRRKK